MNPGASEKEALPTLGGSGRWRAGSVSETESWGEALGRLAQPGQVIGLSGDLGAGKTALTRGIARGLGCPDRVHSPTFALINEYAGGRVPLFHLDLYRLSTSEDVQGAGLEEFLLQPRGVSVVEWCERWTDTEPTSGWWRIRLVTVDESARDIEYDLPRA